LTNRRSPYRIAFIVTALAACVWLSGMKLYAGTQTNAEQKPPAPAVSNSGQKSGEEVFMQNCSRCHKPPMAISPRTTGTVVMHMRVRAKLSRQDEQALLRYLAP
jgi:mono/diheme cytochrome c family protein